MNSDYLKNPAQWIGEKLLDMCKGEIEIVDLDSEYVLKIKSSPEINVFYKNKAFNKKDISYVEDIMSDYDNYIDAARLFIVSNYKTEIKFKELGMPVFIFRHDDFLKRNWNIFFNEISSYSYKGVGINVIFKENKPVSMDDITIDNSDQWYDEEKGEWIEL